MDGTLVEQALDFEEIRSELGISPRNGVLEAIRQMPTAESEPAERVLLEHELAGARAAVLVPGAERIVRKIRTAGIKTALLTRNSREPMQIVLEKFFDGGDLFDLAWSRDDAPVKPDPEGILLTCERLGVAPERTCCVGDYHYDITAAKAAGTASVLLIGGKHREFAHEADHVIDSLSELTEILGI